MAHRPLHLVTLPLVCFALCGGAAFAEPPRSMAMAMAMEDSLVRVISRVEPSVVAIARVDREQPGTGFNFEIRPDPFGLRSVPPAVPGPADPEFIPSDFATGVVVDRRGLILTAYHVLGENSDYYVTAHDRKVYRAWVKGADPRSGLAVLSVEAADLAPVTLGDASKLKKGQIVVALGNPYAIARDGQASASWGIISNLSRKAPAMPSESDPVGKNSLHHFGTLIQTDAKLNFGASGGPLVNLDGQMIGLVTSLAAAAGYEQAAGYAFPVDDTFRRVVDTLKEGREVEYGFLGIQPLNLSTSEVLGGLHGTRVHRIVQGTPAARYGVQPEDVVMSVNGRPIYDADGLILEVGRLPAESNVRLGVLRGTRTMELDVVLTKYAVLGKKIVTQPAPAWRGLRVDYPSAVVDANGRMAADTRLYDTGVAVTEVENRTPAADAGLRAGLIITDVGSQPVRTPREFREAVTGQTGPVSLRFTDSSGQNPDVAVIAAP